MKHSMLIIDLVNSFINVLFLTLCCFVAHLFITNTTLPRNISIQNRSTIKQDKVKHSMLIIDLVNSFINVLFLSLCCFVAHQYITNTTLPRNISIQNRSTIKQDKMKHSMLIIDLVNSFINVLFLSLCCFVAHLFITNTTLPRNISIQNRSTIKQDKMKHSMLIIDLVNSFINVLFLSLCCFVAHLFITNTTLPRNISIQNRSTIKQDKMKHSMLIIDLVNSFINVLFLSLCCFVAHLFITNTTLPRNISIQNRSTIKQDKMKHSMLIIDLVNSSINVLFLTLCCFVAHQYITNTTLPRNISIQNRSTIKQDKMKHSMLIIDLVNSFINVLFLSLCCFVAHLFTTNTTLPRNIFIENRSTIKQDKMKHSMLIIDLVNSSINVLFLSLCCFVAHLFITNTTLPRNISIQNRSTIKQNKMKHSMLIIDLVNSSINVLFLTLCCFVAHLFITNTTLPRNIFI